MLSISIAQKLMRGLHLLDCFRKELPLDDVSEDRDSYSPEHVTDAIAKFYETQQFNLIWFPP